MADNKTTRRNNKSKPKSQANKNVTVEEKNEDVKSETVVEEVTGTVVEGGATDTASEVVDADVAANITEDDSVALGIEGTEVTLEDTPANPDVLDAGNTPARGENPALNIVDEAPFVPTPKVPVQKPAQTPVPSVFDAMANKKEPKSKGLVLIEQSLERYEKVMAVGVQHSIKDGAKAQANLYRTLMRILALEGQEFYQGMDLLTGFITKHRKSMFLETRAFRYFESKDLTLSGAEVKNFERLMHALITLSNRHTRPAALKQIDLEAALSGISDTNMHQRVVEYFTS